MQYIQLYAKNTQNKQKSSICNVVQSAARILADRYFFQDNFTFSQVTAHSTVCVNYRSLKLYHILSCKCNHISS